MDYRFFDKYLNNEITYSNHGYYWNNIFLGKSKENAFSDIERFKNYFYLKKFNFDRRLLSIDFFNKNKIKVLFHETDKILDKNIVENNRKTVIGYYFDNSLRTRLSYEKACHILGLNHIFIFEDEQKNSADKNSAYIRGESEKDIILTTSVFCELLIVRHPSIFFPYFLDWVYNENNISLPFINAGSGHHDHPTQAISDLYFISKSFSENEKITICFFGDCRNVRIIRSLSYLLSIYYSIHIIFLTPIKSKPTNDILEMIKINDSSFEIVSDRNKNKEILKCVDIIYLTRYTEGYILDEEIMKSISNNTLVMHPLPKDNEISSKLIPHKYASIKYIEQMNVSKYVKASIIKHLISI